MPILAVHEGCSAVSASVRTQSRISSSVSTDRPGRELAAVERRERRLVEDVARDPHRLDPLAPVVVGGQVVEQHRRVLPRVASSGCAPSRGCRRTSGRCAPGSRGASVRPARAVVADRDRAGSGTSGSGSRRRRCCGRSRRPRSGWWRRCPRALEQPLERRCAGGCASLQARRDRDRLLARRTGCRPRGGPAGSRRRRAGRATTSMPSGAQVLGVADARELQQLRGVDRAAAQDDLAAPGPAACRRPARR